MGSRPTGEVGGHRELDREDGPAPTNADVLRAGPSDWIGIAANHASGVGRSRRLVEELVDQLRRRGFRADVAWTPEERSALVGRSASGDRACRCLVAVGGDGTVSALLNERPLRPVTVLPAGTENLVARHFGLRRDPGTLAGTIVDGRTVPVDVGVAQGRRFLLMTGFGFDADVVSRHHLTRVSRTGRVRPTHRIAYVQPLLRSSISYRFPPISVRIEDPGAEEELRGTTVFVFNLPRYALGLPFVPIAREDDGWLDLIVFRNPGPFQALYYLCKVVCGIHFNDPGVFHRRVRKVVVTSDQPVPVQLDGDPGGYLLPVGWNQPVHQGSNGFSTPYLRDPSVSSHPSEWKIEILPSALKILTGH